MRVRKQNEQQVIATVFEHGPAHQAGLSANDLLIAINGLKVDSVNDTVDSLVTPYQPGDRITIHVFRRDELRQFELTLAPAAQTECKLNLATTS